MVFKEKVGVTSVKLALAMFAGTFCAVSYAQETNENVQKVEITGSNIKRISIENISPVTTFTREQIARSGATSVLDIIRHLTAAGGNSGEFASSSSFRNGATSVSLRGLPTLVLLNGNRLPNSGSDSYSGVTSVDLNSIPLAAIERIDVLKDGASAIYGTDAVGGVINFIMKKDYQGFDVDTSYGKTTYNDGDIAKFSVSGGFGDRAKSNFNVTYGASFEQAKAIHGVDRPWANKTDFTSMPGGLFQGGVYGAKGTDPGTLSTGGSQRMPDPECSASHVKPYPDAPEWFAAPNRNACMYAQAESQDLAHPYTRYSGAATANYDISATTSLFANLFYNHYDARIIGSPAWIQNADRSSVLTVAANNPFNTYGKTVKIRRLFPAAEGGTGTNVDTTWLVGGMKTQIGDWDLTATIGHSSEDGNTRVYGSFMHDKLQQYVTQGLFNPFGGNHNSAQVINDLTADQYTNTKTKTDFAKLVGSTEFGQLPGGKIGAAVGAEYKRESLAYDPSQAWRDGAIGIYSTLKGINGSESLGAVFGELNLPILTNLEAQAAVRYDRYQLAGNTTNPKVGLRWTPTQTLMIRTSYSTGFRAPTLSQRFNEGRGGFANVRDPKRCVLGDVYFDASCNGSALSLITGTKTLKPETSNQFNLGFVFEPVKDLSFGMTFWSIKWKDKIDNLDNDTVLAGEDGAFKSSVSRYDVTPEDQAAYNSLTAAQRTALGPLVGRLKQLSVGFINRSEVSTSGIDVDASYKLKTANYGNFTLSGDATYTIKYDQSLLPSDPLINCANNMGCEAGQYGNPVLLAKLGLNWEKDVWSASTGVNFTSHYHVDRTPSATINRYYDLYNKGYMIPSMTTVDASVSYAGFKNLVLRFGANNLFNRDPAFDPSSNVGYDNSYGDPRGRYVYAAASYHFN
ncbi:TonB-dependent receptor [Undibacterium jejuense]|uniref:TonB-dependent receptor n=1 Tax=Undibacterium jejuense TaxID=1344949 RepID=A0A923HN56_9BURK|nr:TonB-dependent receptor [Undibacterium jejuense]MBC3862656.1 TonB-dependent receptor [Undibacterium jejuense]